MCSKSASASSRATRSAVIAGILTVSFLAQTGFASANSVQITFNDVDDGWDGSNLVNVEGQVLYHEDLKDIYWYDGVSSTLVQPYDAGVPALDLIAGFVFALGSGSIPGQVVGAWRRGADYAWVWTSDQEPVEVDTYAANLLDPTKPTNPEALAIADGCVFMVMQANDDGTVVRRVFQIDTQTGHPQPVSGSASVFGAGRVVTSQCRAAWVYDPNDNDTGDALPLELQYFDGTTTVTLDRGLTEYRDFDLAGDQLVYVKRVNGFRQVLVIDLSDPARTPQVLSRSSWPKVNPQTDGRHVAWAERVPNTIPDLHRIILNGELDLTPRATQWVPREGHFVFTLSRGQLSWERDDDIFLLDGNDVTVIDRDPAETAKYPQLSAGTIPFVGQAFGATDDEVFVWHGPRPVSGSALPPPMFVRADLGPGRVILRWDRVLGADSYNVYYAETSGVTPSNYQTLPGGARLTTESNSIIVEPLDPTKSYFFVVTSANENEESIESGEVTPQGFLVETTLDLYDDNPGDGICMTDVGLCSLRAAIQEANAANSGLSIALPAGTYLLTLTNESVTTDDLNLLGHMTIVGAGRDLTIIDGNQFDRVIQSNPVDTGTVVLADLTVRNGRLYGILNEGALRLERVAVVDNGPFDQAGGIDQSGSSLEIIDSLVARNQAGSHGGGMLARTGRTFISGSRFLSNTAGLGGGAIYVFPSSDSVVVRGSEFVNNSDLATFFGGGAIFDESGEVYIHDSAIVGNDTGSCGGAILVSAGELHMVNVTVSGNDSETGGGAICTFASSTNPTEITLDNVTFNVNTDGGGAGDTLSLSAFTTAYVKNSILASPGGPTAVNCAGATPPVSLGYNLESGDSCGFGADDLTNTDPLLGTLDDNGGPTSNHAPANTSPAIDGGDPAGCVSYLDTPTATDQRGAARPFDGDGNGTARCDIGAFEHLGDCTDNDGDGFTGGPDPRCKVGESVDCDDGNDGVYPGAPQTCDGLNNDCYHVAWPGLTGTNEADDDGDGLSECAGDCLDADGAVTGTPGEVRDLLFTTPTSLDWVVPSDPGGSSAALSYDLHRSASASDTSLEGLCLESMHGGQIGTDPETPTDGAVFYYLVRARNACPAGIGTWGSPSAGPERTAPTCP